MAELDVVTALAAVAADLGGSLRPRAEQHALTRVCELAVATMGAAAASVAVLDEDRGELRWRAAVGPGAEVVATQVLPLGTGIAGFVAATGRSMAVDDVRADSRFDIAAAERTGFVPTSLLAVPMVEDDDDVLGVLSVLDRTRRADDLEVAARLAAVAAAIVPTGTTLRGLGAVLLDAVADAAEGGVGDADELARALRERAARTPPADAELARVAALLIDLRDLGPRAQAAAIEVLESFVGYARARRRP